MSTPPDLISFDTPIEASTNKTLELRKLFDPLFTDASSTPTVAASRNASRKLRIPPPVPPRCPMKHPVGSGIDNVVNSKPDNVAAEDLASLLDLFLVPSATKPKNTPSSQLPKLQSKPDASESGGYHPRGWDTLLERPVRRRRPLKQQGLAFVPNLQASTELEFFVSAVENLKHQKREARKPRTIVYSFVSPFDDIIGQSLPPDDSSPLHGDSVVFDAVYGQLASSFPRANSIEVGDPVPPRKTSVDQVRGICPKKIKNDKTEAATPTHWKNTPRWTIPQIEVRINMHVGLHAKLCLPQADDASPTAGLKSTGKPRSPAYRSSVLLGSPRVRLVCDPNSTLVSELMMEALSNDVVPHNTDLNVNKYQLRLHGRAELLNPDARLCDCNQVQLCHRLDLPLRLILEPRLHNDSSVLSTGDASTGENFKPQSMPINNSGTIPSEEEIFIAYSVFQNAVDKVRTAFSPGNSLTEERSSTRPSEIQRSSSMLTQSVKAVLAAACQSIAFADVLNALGSVQVMLASVLNDVNRSDVEGSTSAEALVGSIRRGKITDKSLTDLTKEAATSRNVSGLVIGSCVSDEYLQKLERELNALEYSLLAQLSAFFDWRQAGLRVNPDVLTHFHQHSRRQAPQSSFSGRPLGVILDKNAIDTSRLTATREVRSSDTCLDPFLVGLIAIHRLPQVQFPVDSPVDEPGQQNSSPQRIPLNPDHRSDTNFHVLLTLTYAGRRLGQCYPPDLDLQPSIHRTAGQALSRDSFLSDPGRSQRIQPGFRGALHFDQWFKFPGFSISQLPREVLLAVSLFSCKRQTGENPLDGTLFGWVNIPLFDANGHLRQNTIVAGLWPPCERMQEYRPSWSQPNRSSDCPVVQICLPEYQYDIEFPLIQPDNTETFEKSPRTKSDGLVSEANKAISHAQCSIFMHSINPDLSARAATRCLALYSEAASASHRAGRLSKNHTPLPGLRLGALNPVSGDLYTSASGSSTSTIDPISSTLSFPPGVAVEVLWNLRWHLHEQPSALVALLTSVLVVWPQETHGIESTRPVVWSWSALLRAVYSLLVGFPPASPGLALRLLAPDVADQAIRHWAVQSLAVLPPDILLHYLPQLLETVNYDIYLDYSGLASLLLQRSNSSMRFANALFWSLTTALCASPASSPTAGVPSVSSDWRSRRLLLLKSALLYLSHPRLRNAWRRQEEAIGRLTDAALAVKRAKAGSGAIREAILQNHMRSFMEWLNADSCQPSMTCDPSVSGFSNSLPSLPEKEPPLIVLDEPSEKTTQEEELQKTQEQAALSHLSTSSNDVASNPISMYDVGFRMPYNPGLLTHRLDIAACTYFASFTCPLRLVFHALDTGAEPIMTMFKVGDDLRKDSLITQLTFLMDRIWLESGLDLRMIHFRTVPTGDKQGLIELVSECCTLREIQQQGGGLTGPFKESVITNWLQSQNTTELDYIRSLDNFLRSLAGCCVTTYVLGVGDRHNDNIMVRFSGHLFHVDFAKAFGHAQTFAGFKRDRVPFVLTHDMFHVLQAYSKELNDASSTNSSSSLPAGSRLHRASREGVQLFIDYCCQAYNLIRKHAYSLIFLLDMSLSMNIPGVTRDSVRYLMSTLQLELSEQEASQHFTGLIRKTLSSRAPALNFFVHGLAQAKQSSNSAGSSGTSGASVGGTNSAPEMINLVRTSRPTHKSAQRQGSLSPGQIFSFVPKRFTLSERGEIDAVVVEAAVKLRASDKHSDHYFPMSVWRKDCRIPTRVYRRIPDLIELCSVVHDAFSDFADLTNIPLLVGSLTANHVTSIRTQNTAQELIDYLLEADPKIRKVRFPVLLSVLIVPYVSRVMALNDISCLETFANGCIMYRVTWIPMNRL
ncbi:Phosphatidylinositol 4-phosphate 3-kinase C2 domain-containing subunit alpha [Clonorchis sinensis]|uniref:Phosphatidylinositol 4-phosphate 3-kinase C2 domain-containing subunit alpha n=1 Tax=Clonorchis sinensis TaxID=79923 RepID=A0A8T1MHI1_CLOSI|nr:Phosphatidylinositol 4-phosphate 3-kinase C2 domain-containing subunit alpha [Clonorchis sinensis]